MAQRRMFSLQIVDTDAFLDMPQSSQLLYFHLSMRADDDGFVNNPKKILRMIGCNDDDLKVLLTKRFLISFENGVVVIKHWKIHNYIAKDRYTETKYLEEKSTLITKENGAYTECIQPVYTMSTQVRLGKVRLGKVRLESAHAKPVDEITSFFSYGDIYTQLRSMLIEKIPEALVDKELNKFISYWTEPNKSGTKVRWQLQQTFDVKRRLRTWLDKTSQQTIKKGKGLII